MFGTADIDGDETVEFIEWSLNDSSNTAKWNRISKSTTLMTLFEKDGIILNADNKLYMRCYDNGGFRSKILTYPADNKKWFVRKPKGDILIIKDYILPDTIPDAFYTNALNTIGGGKFAQ